MPSVTIYSTPTCQYCKKAKEFFKQHNIKYTEHDVSINPDKAQEMIDKSGQMGVPVIDIDGTITVGFNQAKLSQQLDIKA